MLPKVDMEAVKQSLAAGTHVGLRIRLRARLKRFQEQIEMLRCYDVSVFGEKLGLRATTSCIVIDDIRCFAPYHEEAAKIAKANGMRRTTKLPPVLVLHRCDNGMCINVEHIFYGSQSDNVRDAMLKGRNPGRVAGDVVARLVALEEELPKLQEAISLLEAEIMRRKAFTLIEMLVVIAIVFVITALTLPALKSSRERGLRTVVRTDMASILGACEKYKLNHGHYPIPVWPSPSQNYYGSITAKRLDDVQVDVRTNEFGEFCDPWGTAYLYYPLPIGVRDYSIQEQAILANTTMTGGTQQDYWAFDSKTLGRKLYDRWLEVGSPLRGCKAVVISAGPDRKFTQTMIYGIINWGEGGWDWEDDIGNFMQ